MFDTIYKIAIESNDFEELKSKLKELPIDTIAIKHGFQITVGAQLAIEGKHDKVEWMRQLGANINTIAFGYALAGNHDKVEAYKQHDVNISGIDCGYMVEGNQDTVVTCTQSRRIARVAYDSEADITIARSYTDARNYTYELRRNYEEPKKYDTKDNLIALLNSYMREREDVVDCIGKIKEYFYGSFFSAFQKSFKQKSEAVAALKSVLNGGTRDLIAHLSIYRNGNLGKDLRAFVKSGAGNDLVGKEVTTVSGFIQALHEKNSRPVQNLI